jgi:multimeric flavodoxin WrbA
MKVVAFNGSPRHKGNTSILIEEVFGELKKQGIETELVSIGGSGVKPCKACYGCFEKRNKRCTIQDDPLNGWLQKMLEADAVILGSPTYVTDVTAEMKALIDRACLVSRANDDMFRRKVGAAVVAERRAGAIHAFDTLNHFFTIAQMVVVGSNYWNIGMGREIGEVRQDEEGMKTMRILGENMAWLLNKIHSA